MNGLPASCISDNSQNWTPVLVLHGCCPDIHRLPVGFGQSDKSSVPVACFGETAHASSRDACCGPVDLIGGHAYVRTGLHALNAINCSLAVVRLTNSMLGIHPKASMAICSLPATQVATLRSMMLGGMSGVL